jgi:hypothetical protein
LIQSLVLQLCKTISLQQALYLPDMAGIVLAKGRSGGGVVAERGPIVADLVPGSDVGPFRRPVRVVVA